ncbi:MAG: FliI/YscN family ATPase [Planctomycetaceae bacterium]|nr:FliI/YscN family ATPase [Planctomycetaceae bacterium]
MQQIEQQLEQIVPVALTGTITRIVGLTVSAAGFPAPLGSICRISRGQNDPVVAEVVGFKGDETLLLAFSTLTGVRRGHRVSLVQSVQGAWVGDMLPGRVIDGRGRFLDNRPAPPLPHRAALQRESISPLNRPRISDPLTTGVRAIDGVHTCGKGQRLGIFAGSGVGKSTLLGQIARNSSADINVVCLVGERGREVREFIERDLGPEGLARSVVVVATGDEPAVVRLRAAFLATAVAEYFRDTGKDVLLMMDSVTRLALAQREIGLAAGEPPATRGYPPSVFALLPRLLERSGKNEHGSITGLYTVLVEGDDTNEPVSDTVRGILDGHIMLSRHLAEAGHWPAIDILASISRSMKDVAPANRIAMAERLKQVLAAYRQSEDLINIGAYQKGASGQVDTAVRCLQEIHAFLRQRPDQHSSLEETAQQLQHLIRLFDLPPEPAQPGRRGSAMAQQPAAR